MNMQIRQLIIALAALAAGFGNAQGAFLTDQPPVERHGWLQVKGSALLDQQGDTTQLAGVSFGWHNMWPRFYNPDNVKVLAQDWKADIVRCAIGLDLDENTYDKKPEWALEKVDSIVRGAINEGIYVIIDFHSHDNNVELAKKFFDQVSRKYGNVPNVLYEIWNEPREVPWQEIKDYAAQVIPVIRKNAPRSVVIVPTPRWDQDVDVAAAAPVEGFDNLLYSLHYYAATHQDHYRDKAQKAVDAGLPIIVSESAAMLHTGDGVIDTASWEQWLDMACKNGWSWVAWSLSDKDETCSMLRPSASSRGTNWTEADLKPWAVLVRHYLRLRR